MMLLIIAFVVFAVLMAMVVWLARRNDSGASSESSFANTTSDIAGASDYSSPSHHSGVDCSSSHSADSGSCGH